jgi:PAS domain S-box-containing protein
MPNTPLTAARHGLFRQAFFNGNGLARQLILALVLFSSALTAVITALQLYGSYQSDLKKIDDSFQFIRTSAAPVLVNSVWVSDETQIKTQLEGLLRLRDIEFVGIYVDGKLRWSAGVQTSARLKNEQQQLIRQYRGQNLNIGEVRVIASLDKVWSRLLDQLIAALIENGIKTLLVAAFMLLVVQVLITRHLSMLATHARSLSMHDLEGEDVTLDRPDTGRWRPDALDYLAQAINTMRQNLRSAYGEMRQQSDYIKLLLDSTSEAIFGVDANGICTLVNPSCLRMLGYQHEDDLIGKSIHELIHHTLPDGRPYPKEQCTIRLASRQGEAGHADDEVHWRADGSSFPVEYWSHPMFQNGQLVGTVVAFIDITERKRTEEALKNLNEELETRVTERTIEMKLAKEEAERASVAKSDFLSRMSHELRTPLNAILGFGQLLEMNQKTPLSNLQADNVREIIHAGNHLLELINEILDLSRIESGRLEVNIESISVPTLIRATVSQLQPLAMQRNIRFSLDLNEPCIVQGDLLRLREVLINLLSNAVKYNRQDGEIWISCEPVGEHRTRISVRDSGRGIAADAIPRLFKPFERLESAYDGIDGTGIGLALTKKLVVAMRGEIGVESVQGVGSTFWFELLRATDSQIGNKTAPYPVFNPAAIDGKQRKLLYIEDNQANMRLMRKVISTRKNIELLTAENAEAGLDIALQQLPDLILLDIQLPGMDGFEAMRLLRENPATRAIPVIAVSANAMTRDMERGKLAGFQDYLTKPFDIPKLHSVIDKLLTSDKR